jgi:NADH:ubiquinone reductase (non-electrogenic)
MLGADSIYAIGDCTASSYAPTAQVASQQGGYLARLFAQVAKRDALEKQLMEEHKGQPNAEEEDRICKAIEGIKLRPFHYSHQGSLAYVSGFLVLSLNWVVLTLGLSIGILVLIRPLLIYHCSMGM